MPPNASSLIVNEFTTTAASGINTCPPSTARPAPRKLASPVYRYDSLDCWRGLACLLVVVFHSTQEAFPQYRWSSETTFSWIGSLLQRGWVGVPIFFVVSGYCISAAADAHRTAARPFGTYFIRRFRRIYPPYWIAIATTAMLVIACSGYVLPSFPQGGGDIIPQPQSLSAEQWLGNLTLTETWRANILGGDRGLLFLDIAWTLCFEEQFYFIVGMSLLLSRELGQYLAAFLSICTLAMRHLAPVFGVSLSGLFLNGEWLLFGAGMLVYHAIQRHEASNSWSMSSFIALCVLFLAMAGALGYPVDLFNFRKSAPSFSFNKGSILVGCGFAVVALLAHRWDSLLAKALLLKPFAVCGTMCYSLYLIHFPITKAVSHWLYTSGFDDDRSTVLITVPLCLISSLCVGWLFHLQVERRFLNSRPPAKQLA